MAMNVKQLRRLYEAAKRERKPSRFFEDIDAALESRQIRPSDFSFRELFEAFVDDGYEIVQSWSPRSGGSKSGVMLRESAVNTGAFASITGQILYAAVRDEFDSPSFIGNQLVTTIDTPFSGEKIPGIGGIGDAAENVPPGHPYPMATPVGDYVETPETVKRGLIVPVTKEDLFFDRTGLVLQRAAEVGRYLGINKEKRILDAVLGVVDLYRRNGVGPIPTYGDNSGSHDWDNLSASTPLTDWTSIEKAALLFDDMVDPNTGEPLLVMPDTLVVPTALWNTAMRIVSATEVRTGDGASNSQQTISVNPVAGQYRVLSNAYVKSRSGSSTTWFIGQPAKAFAYMQNWPITVVEAPANSELEFTHDIVFRAKASERGSVAVLEPRYMIKATA